MKLPFNTMLGPVLKHNFTNTILFCQNPTFIISIPYTYLYSVIGLVSIIMISFAVKLVLSFYNFTDGC